MSIDFNGNNEYGRSDTTPITATPFTMACFFRSDTVSSNQVAMWIGDSATPDNHWSMRMSSTAKLQARTEGPNEHTAFTSSDYLINTWHHGCVRFPGTNSRDAFLDGGGKGSNTNGALPTGVDRLTIGRFDDSTPGAHFNGDIFLPTFWNVALTDNEIIAMGARRVHMWKIRPGAIVARYRFDGLSTTDEADLSGNKHNLTLVGAPPQGTNGPVAPYQFLGHGPLIEEATAGRIMGSIARHGGLAGPGGLAGQGGGLAA